ncbi:pilus assembly protein TadC [Lottiidibacillus patelloidae]|uniref:Pilus assembly protein TadC n=1 Tax=Lottiidibacillus patelloidae TaxID=2670334 RepID=A0A263BWM6_9BACI|nr:type II secretion system F family protein [Lottiidibacillus patelloidae]OZM58143.1 pilus assembly protein TadC [Lottiidibacillus patelloidae]
MIYMLFFISTTLFLFSLMQFRVERNDKINRRIAMITETRQVKEKDQEAGETFIKRIVVPILNEMKKNYKRKMPGEKQDVLEKKLLQAGSPFNMTPVDFRLFQIALFLLLPVVFGYYGYLLQGNTSSIFVFGFIGTIVSLLFPNQYLKGKMKKRFALALKELPDILDLLTVSLEAGLGFDSALGKLVSKKEGVLSTEFQRCLEEMRLGKTRREALSGVKDRLEIEEIQRLISAILQAEKLGIGLTKVLKVQSEEIREQRKQRAEEKAMKVPVKMMIPLVLFIFPSLFIVLLGPVAIQFMISFTK